MQCRPGPKAFNAAHGGGQYKELTSICPAVSLNLGPPLPGLVGDADIAVDVLRCLEMATRRTLAD